MLYEIENSVNVYGGTNMKINVNNTGLYYEKQGSGKPLILLHGNGESHKIFNKLADKLSRNFTVYLVDSRNHGESERTQDFSYNTMAEDIVSFINKLNLDKPAVYGFSDGGIIALLIAIEHQNLLSHLIISGANTSPDGIKKRYLRLFKFIYFFTKSPYLKMMFKEPNITQLDKISIPTLITAGEKDMIKDSHTRYIHDKIKDSRLKIFKNENHGSYIVNSGKLYKTILNFINGENIEL